MVLCLLFASASLFCTEQLSACFSPFTRLHPNSSPHNPKVYWPSSFTWHWEYESVPNSQREIWLLQFRVGAGLNPISCKPRAGSRAPHPCDWKGKSLRHLFKNSFYRVPNTCQALLCTWQRKTRRSPLPPPCSLVRNYEKETVIIWGFRESQVSLRIRSEGNI